LEAQRAAVEAYLHRFGGLLRADFTDVQSGKDDDRPRLREALKLCRLTNSILLIAKLDRLSRNVAFLATLQQAGTKFVAVDLPEANELVIHILAAVRRLSGRRFLSAQKPPLLWLKRAEFDWAIRAYSPVIRHQQQLRGKPEPLKAKTAPMSCAK
jgi:hypothetical protein